MAITFAPRRGALLACDFGPDPLDPRTFPLARPPVSAAPELWKVRPVVVVSPDSLNHRHGAGPGVCMVVPFSATEPLTEDAWDVPFEARAYPGLTRACWAKCASLTLVSHARLDRLLAGRGFRTDFLTAPDMARIETGLRAALTL